MTDPLELLHKAILHDVGDAVVLSKDGFQETYTALEAQHDKLAQVHAKASRLEGLVLRNDVGSELWRNRAHIIVNESPRQSAAAIKAKALLEAIDLMEAPCDKQHLRNRIEDIKREAKEQDREQ